MAMFCQWRKLIFPKKIVGSSTDLLLWTLCQGSYKSSNCRKQHGAFFATSCTYSRRNLPEDTEEKKQIPIVEKIGLHSADDKLMGFFTKTEAYKMAKDKNLKLVCIQDPEQADKKYYKLISGKQFFEEKMKSKQEKKESTDFKDCKTLVVGSKISDHDLQTRIKAIKKWLKKKHVVQLTLQGQDTQTSKDSLDSISDTIEKSIQGLGNSQSKTEKSGRTVIVIQPVVNEEPDPGSE